MTFTLLSCHPFPIIIFLTPEKLEGYSLCATTAGLRWPFALIGSFKLALLALTLFGAHSNARWRSTQKRYRLSAFSVAT